MSDTYLHYVTTYLKLTALNFVTFCLCERGDAIVCWCVILLCSPYVIAVARLTCRRMYAETVVAHSEDEAKDTLEKIG